jgi:hypothetical protein
MQVSGAIAESVKLNSADGAPITNLNPLPTTGGGGGGSALSDTVFQDSTGQLFVYRDTGTGVPNAYSIPDWALYVPVGAVITSNATEESSQSMVLLLTRMLNYLNSPMGYDKSLQRARQTAIIESGTVTTVGTVTTLANMAAIGNIQAQILPNGANMAAWQAAVRNRIT